MIIYDSFKPIIIMRTIKFRGQKKTTGEWIYGSLVYSNEIDVAIYFQTENDSVKTMDRVYVNQETVGQFTGLYDKNKREIYEGDILKVEGTRMRIEVRFVRGVFAFLWNGNLDFEAPINSPTQEWAEVIGNIHDNPKLIKRKK